MSYSSFFRYFFVLSAGEGTYRTCKSVRSGCLEKSFPCFSVVYIKRNLIFDITVFQCSEFIIFTKLSLCSHIINRVDSFVNFFSSWKELVSLVTDIFLQFINLFCFLPSPFHVSAQKTSIALTMIVASVFTLVALSLSLSRFSTIVDKTC